MIKGSTRYNLKNIPIPNFSRKIYLILLKARNDEIIQKTITLHNYISMLWSGKGRLENCRLENRRSGKRRSAKGKHEIMTQKRKRKNYLWFLPWFLSLWTFEAILLMSSLMLLLQVQDSRDENSLCKHSRSARELEKMSYSSYSIAFQVS